jgi:NAD(P)-dependent dehydrogenase (short-subunit alcohol dehydrogenase family)
VIATNLTGGWLMMRAVFNASMKEHGGAIVNITADMHRGMPGMAHSGAARAGMFNLTQTAALEWGKYGVRVNAVAPGWIASSGMDTYGGATRAMIPLPETAPARPASGVGGRGQRGRRDLPVVARARPSSRAFRCRSMAARPWASGTGR